MNRWCAFMAMIHLSSTSQIFIGEYTNRWKKSGPDASNSVSMWSWTLVFGHGRNETRHGQKFRRSVLGRVSTGWPVSLAGCSGCRGRDRACGAPHHRARVRPGPQRQWEHDWARCSEIPVPCLATTGAPRRMICNPFCPLPRAQLDRTILRRILLRQTNLFLIHKSAPPDEAARRVCAKYP